MANAFIEKLCGHAALPLEDVALLEAACAVQHSVPARHDLIRKGDKPGPVFVILEGWACRYKLLPEGTRQITAFLMPGGCCDLHASVLEQMEHSIATLDGGAGRHGAPEAHGGADRDPPCDHARVLVDAVGGRGTPFAPGSSAWDGAPASSASRT